jgi:flagellar biosynthesis/type III secretory pathway protein FliH
MASILRKHASVESPAGQSVRPATFALQDLEQRGEEYVRNVRDQAARAVQDANAEAAAIRSRAEAAGRAAAEQAIGQLLDERVGERLKTLLPALEGVVSRIEAARAEWLENWQHAAVDLAVAIAERIVRRELEQDPQLAVVWVRDALELAAGASEIAILLNPDDQEVLAPHVESLAAGVARIASPTVVADTSVTPGGCVIRTKHGIIDARLETQLRRLADEMHG